MQSSLAHDESMTNNESGGNPTDKALSCDMGHVAGQDDFFISGTSAGWSVRSVSRLSRGSHCNVPLFRIPKVRLSSALSLLATDTVS